MHAAQANNLSSRKHSPSVTVTTCSVQRQKGLQELLELQTAAINRDYGFGQCRSPLQRRLYLDEYAAFDNSAVEDCMRIKKAAVKGYGCKR